MRRVAMLALFLALAFAWAGCASPRSNFYSLGSAAKSAAAAADYSVAVGPVTVPAEVDRPQMVVRVGPNEVAVEEFHRWASPLPDAIARAVAGNLSAALGTPYVSVYPEPTSAGARYRVVIDVMAFDSAPGESASLDAVWAVRSARDGTSRAGRTLAREAPREKGYPALAAAHSRALGKMSSDIAEAIRALARGTP